MCTAYGEERVAALCAAQRQGGREFQFGEGQREATNEGVDDFLNGRSGGGAGLATGSLVSSTSTGEVAPFSRN